MLLELAPVAVRGNNRATVGLQGIGLSRDDVADQPDHSKGLGRQGDHSLPASCGGADPGSRIEGNGDSHRRVERLDLTRDGDARKDVARFSGETS